MKYKSFSIISDNIHILNMLLSILALSSIICNLWILKSSVPIGYDVNIYNQLPTQFWFLLILTYIIGTLQILQDNNIMVKKAGFLILLINYVLLLIVPYELGYFTVGNGDVLSYLGEINSIIRTAHTNVDNIYPAAHIIFSETSILSNIGTDRISILLPAYFSLLFVFGIIIFSNSLLGSKKLSYILAPVSFIYYLKYMHFSIAPHAIYFTSVPFFLFILHKYFFNKNNSLSFSILLVIFVLIIPYSHPFIILYIAYLLIGLSFLYIITKKEDKSPYNILLLLFIATTLWVFTNLFYMHAFGAYAHHSFGEDFSRSVTMRGMSTLSKANEAVLWTDILRTFFLCYMRYILPFIVISVVVVKWANNKKSIGNLKSTFETCLQFYIFSMIFDIILVINPYVNHTFERLTTLNCTLYAQIPLFTVSLYILFLRKFTIKSHIIVCILLTLVLFTSIFGSLDSPFVYKSNTAVAFNEVQGMKWWFNHTDATYNITSPLNPQIQYRYSNLFLGWDERPPSIILPPHFGYDDKTFNLKNLYVSVMGHDELLYESVLIFKKDKEAAYSKYDFVKFSNDPNILKIYDSLNIDIYKA